MGEADAVEGLCVRVQQVSKTRALKFYVEAWTVDQVGAPVPIGYLDKGYPTFTAVKQALPKLVEQLKPARLEVVRR